MHLLNEQGSTTVIIKKCRELIKINTNFPKPRYSEFKTLRKGLSCMHLNMVVGILISKQI